MSQISIPRISVEDLDRIKPDLASVVQDAKKLPGMEYADVRIRIDDGPSVVAANSVVEHASMDYDCCYGVRVLARDGSARDGSVGQGYFGGRLGAIDFYKGNVADVIRFAIKQADERALVNGKLKKERMKSYGVFGESLVDTELAPTEIHQDIVLADFSEDPRRASLEDLCERAVSVTEQMRSVDKERIITAAVIIHGLMNRELFCSTQGALIDEAYAKSQARVYANARGSDGTPNESHDDILADMRGLEVLDGKNMHGMALEAFATRHADLVARLAAAPILDGTFENARVVTDGYFNSLLVHEIVGHPSEADRCLGMETGYAGRSWFFRNASMNQIGQRVASPLFNVSSRNDSPGYGRYTYDAEGVPGVPVYHIKDGIFVGFMHSRWSAHVMGLMGIQGQMPNGSMRATNANDVPYIRMKQTGIEPGDSSPSGMIESVEDGFFLCGRKTPSISESRENFRISARETYTIKNGRLAGLFRGGSLTADSRDLMMSIWAVGNDFGLWPLDNCGKALPQQIMYMVNFAPSLGVYGTVVGGYKK